MPTAVAVSGAVSTVASVTTVGAVCVAVSVVISVVVISVAHLLDSPFFCGLCPINYEIVANNWGYCKHFTHPFVPLFRLYWYF